MGQYNLNRILGARHVAVVGASEKAGSIGNALMRNLLEGGFPGKIFPVNPKYGTVHGLSASRSVRELEPGIDLAVIATPIATVPSVVRECIAAQIGGAVILSAGGKEAGGQGREREGAIIEAVGSSGFRIIGPNCLGIIQPAAKLNATFVSGMPSFGNLAFISQSGAICSSILDRAFKEHIGFSHFISIGSMIDVDFGDMIDFLGNDNSVKSILLYIENLTNFRKFMSAARSVARVKPIIVLKAGRSSAGARAAASHTGALVGEDAVYDAAFKRAGIVRVDTIQQLFDCAEIMGKQPRPAGRRLAIITNGGGPGVMAADFLARNGCDPAPLDPATLSQLDAVLPPFWSRNNPIDMLGDAPVERFRNVLDICLRARDFDGILAVFAPQAMMDPMALAEALVAALKGHQYPIFTCWMGGKTVERALDFLNASKIPTFETPERAIRAFLHMVAYTKNQEMLLESPPKLTRELAFDRANADAVFARSANGGFLSEREVRQILAAYGLPVLRSEIARTEEEAVAAAEAIGYPVVMKLLSPDITHKTDAGGVCLDVRSEQGVRRRFQQIVDSASRYREGARIDGVTMQPYLADADYEILLGAKRDPDFGPVLVFGMGGVFTEILKDRALGLPPLNRLLARRMIRETRTHAVLQGYRNRPAADMEQLEEMLMRLSQLLIDFPQIAELDLNPVLIKDGHATVADVRMLTAPSVLASPMHLVISPYPAEYEDRIVTEGGLPISVRPVKPEDAQLFVDLFNVLSPTSIYYRYFGALKELRPEMLARFTQIDYDREIALVAIDEDSTVERMLGVARIIGDPDGRTGEFAVLIGDAWQGKGVGAALLRKCLLIAEERGFRNVHGVVLKENTHMINLGKKIGFSVSLDRESGDYELRIALNGPERATA